MNVFNVMKARMAHETKSLRITSENMSNLHTPHYKARRLADPQKSKGPFHAQLATTHARHLKNRHNQSGDIILEKSGTETLTGNNVSYQNELEKANTASNTHKQMHTLWMAHMEMLTTALKR